MNSQHKIEGKKGNRKDNYSHPLITNLFQKKKETHYNIIPTYQPFIPNHSNRTSAKIIRYTNLNPSINQQAIAFINPFHPEINNLQQASQINRCSNCSCFLNPKCQIFTSQNYICNLCQKEVKCNLQNQHQYKQRYAYQLQVTDQQQYRQYNEKTGNSQKICFIIEASQYNYDRNVHKSIINCINALKNEDLYISLVFFDDKYLMFLDIQTQQLTKIPIKCQNQLLQYNNLPIPSQTMFKSISFFNEEISYIIEIIMYQSLLIETSILSQVILFFSKYLSQPKLLFFVTNLNQKGQNQQKQKKQYLQLFKEKQNLLMKNIMSKVPFSNNMASSKENGKVRQFTEKMHFFVIGIKTTFQQCLAYLKYNLFKFYKTQEAFKIQQNLYYDLYHLITSSKFYHSKFKLKISADMDLLLPQSQIYNAYQNIVISLQKKDDKFKIYNILVRQANLATQIILKLRLNQSDSFKKFFQVQYNLYENQHKKLIILNGGFVNVKEKKIDKLQRIDDEALFNYDLRQCIKQWDKQNYKELKGLIQSKGYQILQSLMLYQKVQNINLPLAMKHYFLYIYMIIKRINEGKLNLNDIYKLMTTNLYNFSKMIYCRCYRVQNDKIRNIKCSESMFEKDGILLLQNGQYLFMMMNNLPLEQIKKIFGYYDTTSSLANQHLELPQLTTNTGLRHIINIIRQENQTAFLKFRIIDQQSLLFQKQILPFFYKKEEHFQMLRRMWKRR